MDKKQIKQRRQAEKMVRTITRFVEDVEVEINSLQDRLSDFKSKIKTCEYCNAPYLEERAGRSKFCSDICRTTSRNEKLKKEA